MATEATFGGWLRQQRRRLDWTQVDVAIAWDEGQKMSLEQAIAYSQMIELFDHR